MGHARTAVVLLLALAATLALAQSYQKGPAVGPLNPYFNDPSSRLMRTSRNKFSYNLMADINTTLYAGQEARLQIATTLFHLERFNGQALWLQHSTPERAHFPMSGLWQLPKSNIWQYARYNISSFFPAFNISGPSAVRVRIVPAYSTRTAQTGIEVECGKQTDVWQESWGMSARSQAWGHEFVFSGFVTFTVPPFPWKACIKDTTDKNATRDGMTRGMDTEDNGWMDFDTGRKVHHVQDPLFVWQGSSDMQVGDFAAIRVGATARDSHAFLGGRRFDATEFAIGTDGLSGDKMKFVPAGFPCTYEKSSSSADARNNFGAALRGDSNGKQYCGSNAVHPVTGDFFNAACVTEGSIADGMFKTGTNTQNPFATHATLVARTRVKTSEALIGYVKLPAAGNYDICFSSEAYRKAATNATVRPMNGQLRNSVPVWFKLYKDSSCLNDVGSLAYKAKPSCASRTTVLTTVAVTNSVTWSAIDTTPGSWGTIKISGSGLSSAAATSWEYSATREYYKTVGGDQFRIVPESAFAATTTAMTRGDLYMTAAGTRLTVQLQVKESAAAAPTTSSVWATRERVRATVTATSALTVAGNYRFDQYFFGQPDRGTYSTSSGCWYNAYDNFGDSGKALFGAPGTQCCTPSSGTTYCSASTCSLSDQWDMGATAAGNLGGNPRSGYSAWQLDATGATDVWAYVRFPKAGHFRVCYRKNDVQNWRAIPIGTTPVGAGLMAGAFSFMPIADFTQMNYTYHINDTQASTWGELVVTSRIADLTTENLNFYVPTVADANVVGSAVKIVDQFQSCYVDAGKTSAHSMNPGLWECAVGECGASESCSGCRGSSDDTSTARKSVVFFVKVPDAGANYRVCFKRGARNWNVLPDYHYTATTGSLNAWYLRPLPAPGVQYELHDNREGTWGKFIFRRTNSATSPFNVKPNNNAFADGDVVRLVVNETSMGKEVYCDAVWGATETAGESYVLQNFLAAQANWDLGLQCAASSTTTTSSCYTQKIAPEVNSIQGRYPYTDIDSKDNTRNVAYADGAVAFVTVPPAFIGRRPVGYKVCYKQPERNWIEAVPKVSAGQYWHLPIATKPVYTVSVAHMTTIVAGSYGYVTITGTTASPVTLATDLLKLVPETSGNCDREAAGTQSLYNNYISLAGTAANTRGGARIVGGTDAQAVLASLATTYATARAYMVFPTVTGRSVVSTRYRVCFMTRATSTTTTANWMHLATITVVSNGITYTGQSRPVLGGVMSLKFLGNQNRPLNTQAGGDAAKLIDDTMPCFGSTDVVPNGVTSAHVGLEMSLSTTAAKTDGIVDLGPTNDLLTPFSILRTTLPHSGTRFKVCYKQVAGPWFEVEQAPIADLEYGLGPNGVQPDASGLTSFTVASAVLGQYPGETAQTNYSTGVAFTTLVVGGASSLKVESSVTTPYFYVTMASGVASTTSDRWKLVQAAVEAPRGVWTDVPLQDCASPSALTGSVSIASGTGQGNMHLNFPQSGRWFVCYQRSGWNVWVQVAAASTTYGNPFTVVPNEMSFVADLTGPSLAVTDRWTFNNVQQGGLSNNDTVYMVNNSDVCGVAQSYNRYAIATAALMLNNSATNTVQASRSIGQTVWWLSSANLTGYTGWFKVCVFRSQSTKVNNTGATSLTPKPFVQSGWYQIENAGASATGGGSPFFVNSQPAKLVIDACPPYNMTRKIRTGRTFDMTVYTADANNNRMDFSVGTYAYEVTAGSADTAQTLALQNTGGSCKSADAPNYGWAASNLRQYTEKGKVTFTLAAIGACPSGGCRLAFSTTASGITSTQTCTFDVMPTTVSRLEVVSGPTTCRLGQVCRVRVAAYDADNSLAYASTNAVIVTPTNFAGLSIRLNGGSSLASASAAGNLANGFIEGTFEFSATSGALFAADTAVSLSFSANGKNATHTITVLRPVMSAVHIIDLYPDASVLKTITQVRADANPDFFVRSAMVPTWEPTSTTGFWRGGRNINDGVSVLSAANGYHLVAQQYYTVVLRAVATAGGVAEYVTASTLLDTTKAITMVTDALTTAGNAVIGSCSSESCTNAFTSVSFSSVKQAVTFRLRNSKGCEKSKGGCTLQFQFGGANLGGVTSITTPVRSIAVSLGGECWADDGVVTYDSSTLTSGSTSCTGVSSTVENGWLLRVTARDMFGDVDEYFDGNMIAVLTSGDGVTSSAGVNLTTVADLRSGAGAKLLTATATSGVAVMPTVTLSRPCASGCSLQVLSDWGANIVDMGNLVATASTRKLSCSLSGWNGTVLGKYDPVAQRTISGPFSYDANTAGNNVGTMIYEDTPICITVNAVNANNVRTLYETNWVLYFAEGGAVTITDTNNNADRRRYRPMARSTVQFCFTVSYSATTATAESKTFSLRFVAQRFNDAGYWATGTNGECTMGTFTVFKKKNIAGLRVTRAEGMNVITTLPASSVVVGSQRQSSTAATALKVEFGVVDHYGRAITSTAMQETGYGVVVRSCKGTTTGGLDSTCTTGTTGSPDGSPVVTTTRDEAEAGVVTVTVGSGTAVELGSSTTPTYALSFDKWCLGCQLTFDVKKGTDLLTTKLITDGSIVSSISATLNVNILIQLDTNIGRRLAFVKSTSPYRSSYWQSWAASSTSATSGTVLFSTACFDTSSATSTSSCYAKETIGMQQAVCDPRGATTIAAGASNAPIKMYVVVTEAAATPLEKDLSEPICGTSGVSAPCTTSASIAMQVDILNTYQIAVSIGNQLLQCTGTACAGDKTASPSQIIAASGATAVEAITKFSGFASTSFLLQGINPSNFYSVDSSNQVRTIPSVNGKFAATATTNASSVTVTGITSANNFIWRGPQLAKSFVVRDTSADVPCMDVPKFDCHSGSTGSCAYDGYKQTATLSTIAFPYAKGSSVIPVGVEFPITVDVNDASAMRVWTATGTVTVAVESWVGCNNGGTLTVVGSASRQVQLDNGRASMWLRFSAPCQNCVLSFTLAPSSSQSALYADMINNPGVLVARSKTIEVRGTVAGSHVFVTAPLPAALTATKTIADTISLSLATVGRLGNLYVADTSATVTVNAYNTIIGTTKNWWWIGNGGVLRTSKAAAFTDRHAVTNTFTGSGTLDFLFTRTCSGCSVTVAFVIGTQTGSFLVKNAAGTLFTVETAQSQQVLVGYRPRSVRRGRDIGVGVWHMGSELASEASSPIAYAGVASKAATSLARVSKTVDNVTNGDGGAVTAMGWMTDRAEAHRIQLFAPCDKCTLRIGTDQMGINVFTAATHLRFDLAGSTTKHFAESFPMTNRYFSFTLFAADNDGYVDRWFGGYGFDCAFSLPFNCPTSTSASLSASLSANGVSNGGFLPTGIIGFQTADSDATKIAGTFRPGASSIVDGVARVQVAFGSPVNRATPLFSSAFGGRTITSAVPTGLLIDVPTVAINPASDRLVLASDSATTAVAMSAMSVLVGLVRSVDSTQAMYVVGTADNTVTATFGTGCPGRAASSTTSVKLVDGIGRLSIVFSEATAANTQCEITLTAGAGSGVCTTCTKRLTVTVSAVTATKWVWVRPTTMDNGGSLVAGPMFGAAGRRTYFRVSTRGVDPRDSSVEVPVACPGCTFEIDFSSCGTNSPSTTPLTAQFDANGTAAIAVQWRSTPTSYNCGYRASVKLSTNVALSGEPTNAAGEVAVCTPARVVMVTNVTSAFSGMVLRTGRAYRFEARMVDATGRHCPGDSQDDATTLTVEAVTSERVPRVSELVKVVNVNLLDTTTEGVAAAAAAAARPRAPADPYAAPAAVGARNTVKAVFGGFNFSVVFSNTTTVPGAMPVRVRVTASSATPAIAGANAEALSGAVDTMIAATMLRFLPESQLPRFAVSNWNFSAVNPAATSTAAMAPRTNFVVQAVDDVDASWVGLNLVKVAPNVARRGTEAGNNAQVQWSVEPTVTGAFPIAFTLGSRTTTLMSGEARFDGLAWTSSTEGTFSVSIAPTSDTTIKATRPYLLTVQALSRILINTTDFAPNSGSFCSSDCVLPNSTFTQTVDNATQVQFLNATALKPVNVSVFVADVNNKPVVADSHSVLMAELDSTTTRATLALPDAYTRTAPLYARVMNGVARFYIGFLGSTEVFAGSGNHSRVRVRFSCPRMRPASLVNAWESLDNPCFTRLQSSVATTRLVQVGATGAPPGAFTTDNVKEAAPRIKLSTNLASIALFNATDFARTLAASLNNNGFKYINGDNAGQVITVVACDVAPEFGNADLGATVCGAGNRCASRGVNCPNFVLQCLCPNSAARALLLNRFLMQSSSKVQVEVSFALDKAVGFTGTNEADIVAAYTSLKDVSQRVLKSDAALVNGFGIDVNSVTGTSVNAPAVTASPAPTPNPPTPPPPTPVPTPEAGASAIQVLLALVLAFALSVLAL